MKIPIRYIMSCLLLISLGCHSHESRTSHHSESAKDSTPHVGLGSGHYEFCYVTSDDTAILGLDVSERGVEGKLLLQYLGRERTDGRFENAYFRGDTLITDYRYWNDEGQFLREMVFLIRNEKAFEGFGRLTTQGDKEVFVSHKTIQFNAPPLLVDGCGHRVPTYSHE